MRRHLIVLAGVLMLTGCAGPAGIIGGMSPKALREYAKIKSSDITCVRAMYAGASITSVFVSVDKGIPTNMTVGEDCKLTTTTVPPPKAPAP